GVRLEDANRDGLMDIAAGWEEGGVIRVYLQPETAKVKQPWPAVTVGEVNSPEDAVFVDLDGDGAMDVVSCCEGTVKSVYIHWAPKNKQDYLNAAAWKTEAFPACQGAMQWMNGLPMQVDGQRGVDLVLGAKGSGARIGWLESPPNPRELAAWAWRPIYDAGWIMSIESADMDSDGDDDLLVTDRKGPSRGCLWLENPGPGPQLTAYWKQRRIGGEDKEVMFLDYADIGGDGRREVAAAVSGSELLVFQKPDSLLERWNKFSIPFPPNAGTGKGIRIADFDGDKRADIVFSCENAKGKIGVWLLSQRKGEMDWIAQDVSGLEGTKYDLVQALDLDGDGDLDIVTCEERENLGVIWYENPANP
ncbi:MAG: VCBS repeat-containing protein, partial [Candidatus Omnitrophota bacterium]